MFFSPNKSVLQPHPAQDQSAGGGQGGLPGKQGGGGLLPAEAVVRVGKDLPLAVGQGGVEGDVCGAVEQQQLVPAAGRAAVVQLEGCGQPSRPPRAQQAGGCFGPLVAQGGQLPAQGDQAAVVVGQVFPGAGPGPGPVQLV